MTNSVLVLSLAATLLVSQAVAQSPPAILSVDRPSDNMRLAPTEHQQLVEVESAGVDYDVATAETAASDDWFDCSCCDCAARWEFRAAWLYWTREDAHDTPLLFNSGGNVLFDASQLDFDWESGWEVSAKRSLGRRWDLDIRYFQVDSYEATAFAQTVAGDLAFDGIGIALNADHSFTYDSEMYSGEVNFLRTGCGAAAHFLAGFRYVRVRENLHQFLDTGLALGTFDFETENDLYGMQIGATFDLYHQCGGPLQVNGVVKAGIYYADCDSRFMTGADLTPFDLRDADDDEAFVGEVGLSASYQVNSWLGIEADYHLLGIDGIAMASEQAATTNPFTTNTIFINEGSVLYHGFNFGIVATR